MNKELMDKFRAALERRGCSTGRFIIDRWSEEDIKGFLHLAYKKEVEERRSEIIEDEATMTKIAKAAKWLTGDYKPGLLLYGGVGNGKTTRLRLSVKQSGSCMIVPTPMKGKACVGSQLWRLLNVQVILNHSPG